tara:strand:+ start:351 stop:548 length:198 start_codon:yes stop_codon:yes gene_type:complete
VDLPQPFDAKGNIAWLFYLANFSSRFLYTAGENLKAKKPPKDATKKSFERNAVLCQKNWTFNRNP